MSAWEDFEKALAELRAAAAAGVQRLKEGPPVEPHERTLIENTERLLREYDEAKASRVDDCCWLDTPCPEHSPPRAPGCTCNPPRDAKHEPGCKRHGCTCPYVLSDGLHYSQCKLFSP